MHIKWRSKSSANSAFVCFAASQFRRSQAPGKAAALLCACQRLDLDCVCCSSRPWDAERSFFGRKHKWTPSISSSFVRHSYTKRYFQKFHSFIYSLSLTAWFCMLSWWASKSVVCFHFNWFWHLQYSAHRLKRACALAVSRADARFKRMCLQHQNLFRCGF